MQINLLGFATVQCWFFLVKMSAESKEYFTFIFCSTQPPLSLSLSLQTMQAARCPTDELSLTNCAVVSEKDLQSGQWVVIVMVAVNTSAQPASLHLSVQTFICLPILPPIIHPEGCRCMWELLPSYFLFCTTGGLHHCQEYCWTNYAVG